MFFSSYRALSELASTPVMALALADNGNSLLVCEETSVAEWDTASLTPVHTYHRGKGFERLALSSDEKLIAVGDNCGRVQVINRVHRNYLPWSQWHVLPVADLLLREGGTLVIASYGTSEWDPKRGEKLLFSFEFDMEKMRQHQGGDGSSLFSLYTVGAVRELPDGRIVTCSSDGYLRIFDSKHRTVERSIEIGDDVLTSLDITLPGRAVIGTAKGEVIVVDLLTGNTLWNVKVSDEWIAQVVVTPGRKQIVALGESLEILEVRDGSRLQSFSLEEDPALCGVFSPCGTYLYVGLHYNGVLRCEVA